MARAGAGVGCFARWLHCSPFVYFCNLWMSDLDRPDVSEATRIKCT